MGSATFDALNYYEKLKEAVMPKQQAKIQTEAFKDFARIQEERNKEDPTTKGDIKDVRIEMQQLGKDLRLEMQAMKYDLLK